MNEKVPLHTSVQRHRTENTNHFRTIISLYDIVCVKVVYVIMIVPFLGWYTISIPCVAEKYK